MLINNPTEYYVNKFINWELIEKRLNQFKYLRKYFPISLLKKHSHSKPYYCHYMSWRLGTWPDNCDKTFQFIDDLLKESEKFHNWEKEKNLMNSNDFATFWGLLWQMQVGYYLKNILSFEEVCWNSNKKGGPDLVIKKDNLKYYVECYAFLKSYYIDNFLSELLTLINPKIGLKNQIYLKHRLLTDNNISLFLDEILERLCDEVYLKRKIKEADDKYPVMIFNSPERNLYIYIEGNNIEKYAPNVLPTGGGDPNLFAGHMVNEAIKNKSKSNKLRDCHPNFLMINFLISADFQSIINHSHAIKVEINRKLSEHIDNIIITCCGINEIPNHKNFMFIKQKNNLVI